MPNSKFPLNDQYPSDDYSLAEFVCDEVSESTDNTKDDYFDSGWHNATLEDIKKLEAIGQERMKKFLNKKATSNSPIQEPEVASKMSTQELKQSNVDNSNKLQF